MENGVAGAELTHEVSSPGCATSGCLLWFLGGISLSFTIVLSLILMVMLMASVALNLYLGWQLAELEITVNRISPTPPPVIVVTATQALAMAQPAGTPVVAAQSVATPVVVVVTATPTPSATPVPANVQVETQRSTVAALATTQAPDSGNPAAYVPPASPGEAVPINPTAGTSAGATVNLPDTGTTGIQQSAPVDPAGAPPAADSQATQAQAPFVSSNTYSKIPIEGERESRPAETHGDLNLKLREPEQIDEDLALVDIDNAGSDPNAPDFQKIFEPNFVAAYAVHGWDWGSNSKGKLIEDDKAILVGIKTTPGEPVYIPPTERDIYHGKYYATLLYADEDSLTFVYTRNGNVVKGYTVHYWGLDVDPNLLKLFRESKGNELPGLTLDTPVGRARDELIVGIRDNGTFLDARSRADWWK